ncbi:hypothetical protein [Microcoleus sp. B9-D4]|uniref:hypothetical protein n=1 Tax=Microcoleus sp. B9-D4 TaxID=2818711 RepID=UPI002FD692CD
MRANSATFHIELSLSDQLWISLGNYWALKFCSSTTATSPLGDEGSVGLLLSIVNQDGLPLNHAFIEYASSGGTLLF